jgi:hypothetical protein
MADAWVVIEWGTGNELANLESPDYDPADLIERFRTTVRVYSLNADGTRGRATDMWHLACIGGCGREARYKGGLMAGGQIQAYCGPCARKTGVLEDRPRDRRREMTGRRVPLGRPPTPPRSCRTPIN